MVLLLQSLDLRKPRISSLGIVFFARRAKNTIQKKERTMLPQARIAFAKVLNLFRQVAAILVPARRQPLRQRGMGTGGAAQIGHGGSGSQVVQRARGWVVRYQRPAAEFGSVDAAHEIRVVEHAMQQRDIG